MSLFFATLFLLGSFLFFFLPPFFFFPFSFLLFVDRAFSVYQGIWCHCQFVDGLFLRFFFFFFFDFLLSFFLCQISFLPRRSLARVVMSCSQLLIHFLFFLLTYWKKYVLKKKKCSGRSTPNKAHVGLNCMDLFTQLFPFTLLIIVLVFDFRQ